MNYKYTIVNMCDECRMTLLRNSAISSKYFFHEMSPGKTNDCRICGRGKRLTMSVLTDYRSRSEETIETLRAKATRSIDEGFALLLLEDESPENATAQ